MVRRPRPATAGCALGLLALLLASGPLVAEEPTGADERVGGLIEAVRAREIELERQARELDERERTVGQLEARVEERLAELREIQRLVEERITEWEGQDDARIKRLAKVYESMPPDSVAPLLENLELDLATSIVSRMKAKKSGAVLAVMDPEEALVLSRRVARPLQPRPENPEGAP